MATITGVTGTQYVKGTKPYGLNNTQYASSSYQTENRMEPALIVSPKDMDEIAKVLAYAKSEKIAVAIKTGGHQYSGASSTIAPNIQLDLATTFRGPNDLKVLHAPDGETLVRTSVSHSLGEFNSFLGEHNLFVPHGQCTTVHLGGHVQTGGYGQLGRSFGLLGDHVISLEIVDHEGKVKEVTIKSDKELFSAILGGSPGNFGVITHFTLKVYRDQDYEGSWGVKSVYEYTPATLKRLLGYMVEMSDNENFPCNYDYCVSVLSDKFKLASLVPNWDGAHKFHMIVVYAQWVPFAKSDVCDKAWFERFRADSLSFPLSQNPMSKLTKDWIFDESREFYNPYVKRTYLSDSKTLAATGWANWVTERIDKVIVPEENKCWLSAQFQPFGGKQSQFFKNKDNGTSYSWRDSTICCTLDIFYGADHKKTAQEWHDVNDHQGIGTDGKFSKQERRVLWGSFGNYDLNDCWELYHEDQEKYDRLRKARSAADPDGIFTPNTFSVARE
jgi:hypothetical protein